MKAEGILTAAMLSNGHPPTASLHPQLRAVK